MGRGDGPHSEANNMMAILGVVADMMGGGQGDVEEVEVVEVEDGDLEEVQVVEVEDGDLEEVQVVEIVEVEDLEEVLEVEENQG